MGRVLTAHGGKDALVQPVELMLAAQGDGAALGGAGQRAQAGDGADDFRILTGEIGMRELQQLLDFLFHGRDRFRRVIADLGFRSADQVLALPRHDEEIPAAARDRQDEAGMGRQAGGDEMDALAQAHLGLGGGKRRLGHLVGPGPQGQGQMPCTMNHLPSRKAIQDRNFQHTVPGAFHTLEGLVVMDIRAQRARVHQVFQDQAGIVHHAIGILIRPAVLFRQEMRLQAAQFRGRYPAMRIDAEPAGQEIVQGETGLDAGASMASQPGAREQEPARLHQMGGNPEQLGPLANRIPHQREIEGFQVAKAPMQ